MRKTRFDSQQIMITVTLAVMGIFYALFLVFPILYALWGSFCDWNPMVGKMNFVGLDNYIGVFRSPVFKKAIGNTLAFTFLVTLGRVVLGMILAVCVYEIKRFTSFFRCVYFLPVVASLVAISLVWVWIFEPTNGIFNQVILFFGGTPLGWLKDQHLALPSIMIATLWKDVGFAMIFYLAGLSGISPSLYEAAEVDGATVLQKFFKIQLPLLTPATVLISITGIIGYIQMFDQVFTMAEKGAGPNNATITAVYYLYDEAFLNYRFGNAAVIAFVIFALTLVASVIQMRLDKEGSAT